MATAKLILDNVTGYSAPAKVWKLDPPANIRGEQHEYVTTWIERGTRYQAPEVVAIWTNERGGAVGRSVIRRAGSHTLHDTPDTPEYEAGAHWLALQLLGGYDVAGPLAKDAS